MRKVYRVAGADLDPPPSRSGIASTAPSGRSPGRRRPISSSSASRCRATPRSSTGRTGSSRGRGTPRPPQVVSEPTSSFPTSRRSPIRPGSSPAETSDSLYRTPLYLLLTEGPAAKFTAPAPLQRDGRRATGPPSTSTRSRSGRGASSSSWAAGSWSATWTTGSPTRSARSPSSTPTCCSARAPPRSRRASRSAGCSPWRRPRSSACRTRYSLGERGAINLIGMYQREQSAFTRPALGFEATANLIGGVNTELHFRPRASPAPQRPDLQRPRPRRRCSTSTPSSPSPSPIPTGRARRTWRSSSRRPGVQVSMRETRWEFGSQPEDAGGLEDIGFAAVRPGGRRPAHLAEPGAGRRAPPAGRAPAPGHRHPDPAGGTGRGAGAGALPDPACRHGGRHRAAQQQLALDRSRAATSRPGGARW